MTSPLFSGKHPVIKSYDHTCNNTFARTCNVIDNVRVNNGFSDWNNANFEGDKILFKWSYDKQNLTLVVISYEIYETRQRLVS